MANHEELKPNLTRLLLQQLEDSYWSIGQSGRKQRCVAGAPSIGFAPQTGLVAMSACKNTWLQAPEKLVAAEYRPRSFLRRRAPDEIETALTQLDQGALNMVKRSFRSNLDLAEFAEAIVSTGTYDADRILAFVSGVVDLYLEVFRSQSERAAEPAVKWAQVASLGPKSSSSNLAQVRRSNLVDCAKHMGSMIRKINWMPSLEMLTTVEGTESVYFWSPTMAWESRMVTPQLPADFFEHQKPLWTVHAVAWDNDAQDLVALLSNRFLIFWRLRNREKGQFQQKKEFRFHATREGRASQWQVLLRTLDPKTGDPEPGSSKARSNSEAAARRDKREARLAAEAAQQLDIWWNASMKTWVTADYAGRRRLPKTANSNRHADSKGQIVDVFHMSQQEANKICGELLSEAPQSAEDVLLVMLGALLVILAESRALKRPDTAKWKETAEPEVAEADMRTARDELQQAEAFLKENGTALPQDKVQPLCALCTRFTQFAHQLGASQDVMVSQGMAPSKVQGGDLHPLPDYQQRVMIVEQEPKQEGEMDELFDTAEEEPPPPNVPASFCPFFESGNCQAGDACVFSHSTTAPEGGETESKKDQLAAYKSRLMEEASYLQIFDFVGLPRDGAIGYEDFLKLASSKNGLIYPVEEERRTLGQDKSIDKYLKE
ncbi:unnamed protein product [Effrenium voratum]|uniref:C3H1-type domain-containing protein n=1 Tax=Effrenium voratum TaxID=2562239 RepID=A0AA36HN82_9DINO|nr:unnamed protein product [Effrenium voratum]